MKYLLILATLTTSLNAFGQNAKLETNNPIPRQGDEIEITFSVKESDLGHIESKDKKTKEDYNAIRDNNLGSGSFKINELMTDTGNVIIGPFSFTIEGKVYTTDTLVIKVHPKLPNDIKDGIWIRYTKYNDKGYLIVEQRVSNEPKVKNTSTGRTVSLDNDGITFAELDQDKFEAFGVDINYSSTKSSMQTLEETNDNIFSGMVSYKISTYTFKFRQDFKGPIKLGKNLFKYFPDNLLTKEVIVNN
jgi:hypothetical protein